MRRLAVLAAASLLLAACGTEPPAPSATEGRSLLPEDRLALPEYDLATFEALLAELRGVPVVVNIWGSWCPPCRVEAPELAEVSRRFEGQVQFVGVDILDTRPAARDFILQADWPYPSVFDPTGAIRDGLGYVGQPVTIVYDARGTKTFEWVGAVTGDQLREEIRKVL
ncbi:MAG TPA: TlpA disulfide reductase family protein [Actinomycetota bacterium]|nr:TlpA disulfide reductase family protein [Actinomycetota bacterium]